MAWMEGRARKLLPYIVSTWRRGFQTAVVCACWCGGLPYSWFLQPLKGLSGKGSKHARGHGVAKVAAFGNAEAARRAEELDVCV